MRFQIADVLESIRGPRAAELNAALLADPDVSVVSAAAFNLSRHPTDVATLARALAREDLWAIEHPRALPLLMAAVMRSPDLDAGDLARRLVRRYLAASDQPSPKLHRSPRDLYFSGLFDASPAPAVSRALLALLPEIDEAHDDALLRVVFHTREPLEIRDELAPLPLARAAPIVARMLGAPDRFRVPDDLLLRLLDEDSAHRHHPDHARILAAAVERRCPALVPWLRRQLAQPHALHGTPSPLDALLELAPHAAHDDLRDLLVGGAPPHRREVAHLLVGCDHPALADLRDPAYALLCGDADEAVALVEYADPQRCAGHLDAVLTRSPPDIRRRVVRRFWERTDVAPFLRTLRGEPPPDLSVRDPRVPEPLRVLLVRSLLTDTDPTVTDVFLHHRDALREPLVHAYVLDRIERGEAPISCHDLWLLHAREPAWSPDLATIVRLVRDGHVDHGLTRHIAPDDLFTALRSLLGAPDRALRLRALCMLRVPDLHRAAFIDLLANPEFRRHVTHRLCQAGVVAAFPAILGYFDILDSDSREPPARDPDHPPGFLDGPLYWHEFEPHLKTAPAEHLRACLPLLARHIDTPPRVHAFLDVFARAPDFAYHSTLLVAARVKGVFRQEDLFDAWVRSAQTFEQRSTLLRLLDDPDLPVLLLARALAEHPYPETAAFAVERLQHAVDRPWDPVIRPDSSELHWLAQVLARLATPEQTHRLDRLAARAGDVLLSRLLHRILADIHERTGIYALHHTRMPRHGFTLLHLSDLHFHTVDQAERWHSALAEDLRRELRVDALDALVLSGDIVDRGRAAGYPIAAAFIERLCREFRLPRERVVVVPGNHDVDRAAAEPAIRPLPRARRRMPGPDEFEVGGKRYAIHDREGYRGRLAAFARFFADTLARPYPLDEAEQALLWVWPEPAIVVLGLSSVGELDGLRPDHATIDDRALSRALDRLRGEAELPDDALKIAVFHHPIHSAGDDRLRSSAFLDRLAQAGFSLVLHGHVHRADGMLFRYDRTLSGRRLEIVGAGTFGSRQHELVPGIPWQYNLLRFTGDSVQVATRRRESEQGPWRPDARWTSGPGSAAQAHYDLDLRAADPTVTR